MGLSGSGKSTLAFDILFNEGQRRYLESLNAYARSIVQPAGRPEVDAVYGIHNWPGLKVGQFALSSGPIYASSNEFKIVVQGKGSHAAMPNLGIDPVPVAGLTGTYGVFAPDGRALALVGERDGLARPVVVLAPA